MAPLHGTPQSAFYELQQEEDSDFAYAIQLMIARQLSDKLKEARQSQSQLSDQLTEQLPRPPSSAGADGKRPIIALLCGNSSSLNQAVSRACEPPSAAPRASSLSPPGPPRSLSAARRACLALRAAIVR